MHIRIRFFTGEILEFILEYIIELDIYLLKFYHKLDIVDLDIQLSI